MNYSTTEKELLAVVFALNKFFSYILGSLVVVFTNDAALKYRLSKKDAKPRLIRWILLLQEFNIIIKDKNGVENVVADHLPRLTFNESMDALPIRDSFLDEQLVSISTLHWHVDIVNFLFTGQTLSHWNAQDKKSFMVEVRNFFYDDPYLFKYYPDQIIRRCVLIMKFVEAIFLQGKPLQRFCNVVFIGLICLKTLIIFANIVSLVKSWEE